MPDQRAGAITVRRYRGRTLLLLVRGKGGTRRVFPKGHVERHESAAEAALRELEEEAGIQGRILAPAKKTGFRVESVIGSVDYFLVLATGRVSDGETGRDPIWVDPKVALSLLEYDDVRNLLDKLLPVINGLTPAGSPGPEGYDNLQSADFQKPDLTAHSSISLWRLFHWGRRLLHRRRWESEALRQ